HGWVARGGEQDAAVDKGPAIRGERRYLGADVASEHLRDVVRLVEWTMGRSAVGAHPELVVAADVAAPGFLVEEKGPVVGGNNKVELVGAAIVEGERLVADHDPLGRELLQLGGGETLAFGRELRSVNQLGHCSLLQSVTLCFHTPTMQHQVILLVQYRARI